MKIIALGGAGDVGSRAVEMLAEQADVAEVTVADRNLAAAQRLADRLGTAHAAVQAASVDAADHRSLVDAMAGHDLAVSAIGPYFRFESRLVAAALDAGIDYASVCDEWDATEAVFAEHGHRARERGRLVLLGLGTSPGMTNVGVRLLADELDSIDRVVVCVYQPLDAGGGEAVVRHMLHIMTGQIALWRGGRRVLLPALGESRVVRFPRFGEVRLWTMGHAEPVTLPRYLEGVEEVSFFMGYGRGASWLVRPARAGLFRSGLVSEAVVRGLVAIERWTASSAPADGAVRIDVWGRKDGEPAHRLLCGTGQMREATGVSLAIGGLMIGRGQLRGEPVGVMAPEACLEPASFVAAMRAAGIAAYADLEMSEPL